MRDQQRLFAGRAQALTDPPRLLAPGRVQIALGAAVGKAEVSGVAKAGGMPESSGLFNPFPPRRE